MQGVETGGGRARRKPRRKPSPPSQPVGVLAPKGRPTGVFADPVPHAPRVTARRAPTQTPAQRRRSEVRDTKAAADVARGRPASDRAIAEARQRVGEIRDTKGNAERARADRFKQTPAYRQSLSAAAGVVGQEGTVKKRGLLAELSHDLGVVFRNGRAPVSKDGGGRRGTPGASFRLPVATATEGLPFRAATLIGRAAAEDPKGVGLGTLRGGRDALIGIPGAVAGMAADTVGGIRHGDPLRPIKHTAKAYGEDLARRYGPLARGDDRAFVQRIKREGAFGELADASTLISGGTVAAGRALGGAARAGKLGAALEDVATKPRRRIRTTGGESAEQPVSRNLIVAAAQKRRDEAAVRGSRRLVERADRQAAAVRARTGSGAKRGRVDAVVRQAAQAGEVVPSRRSLRRPSERVPSGRRIEKAQRVGVARTKGRALQDLRTEQRAELGAAQRNLASLSKPELRAFKAALQLGITSPAAARRVLPARIAQIERARAKGAEVLGADETPMLRRLLAEADQHFTPQLARVVREERARAARVAAGDPGLGATPEIRAHVAELRTAVPQGEALGVVRQGTPIREAEQAARQEERRAKRARARARSDGRQRVQDAARAQGRAEIQVAQADTRLQERIAGAERAVTIHQKAAANHQRRAKVARQDGTRRAAVHAAEAAQERASRAQARLETLKMSESASPRPALGKLERERGRLLQSEQRQAVAVEQVAAARAARQELAAARRDGKTLVDAESDDALLARIDTARREAGAEEPGFYPSRKREQSMFSVRTVGGSKAVRPDRAYTGALFREGREHASPATYVQGVARNIKRKHNWGHVADAFERHTFDWGRGKTIGQLQDELERRGIDPASVAFWNPERYREQRATFERQGGGEDQGGAASETGDEQVHEAVGKSARPADGDLEHFRGTGGRWSVVPREVYDEIHADTRPSSAAARGFDVVKSKQARVMLGTSPKWLQYQVAANALLTGLAGTGPGDLVKAQRWWRGLTDEQRRAVEPYIGTGHFHDSVQQPKIGAASNASIVNAWRAMKETEFWHKPRRALRGRTVSQANPLDLLFRVDNAQNNAFRRAVLYSQIKRDAYRRMGQNATALQQLQDRLVGALSLGPREQIAALIKDQRAVERHAEHVNDFLGDYLTYSARERRTFGRAVMFYGFLRFSLRFTFYTLPVKHPIMASILSQLGRMQTDEVRKLLGGDELPWALGKLYFTSSGKLKSISVAQANPALNSLTQMRGPKDLVGLLPPVAVALLDQAYSKSSFADRPFRVQGETQGRKGAEYSLEDRGRILANDALGLAAPYRAWQAVGAHGPEGDDSLPWSRRPTQYNDPEILASIDEDQARRPSGVGGRLLQELVPFVPRDDASPEMAARIRAQQGGAKNVPINVPANLNESSGRQDRVGAALEAVGRRRAVSADSRIQRALEAVAELRGGR